MNTKEKAQELIEKFKDYVHGYVGSSMLTNHEYPEQIIKQAKKCALIAVDEILNSRPAITDSQVEYNYYWSEVKKEIELTPRPDNTNNTPCND